MWRAKIEKAIVGFTEFKKNEEETDLASKIAQEAYFKFTKDINLFNDRIHTDITTFQNNYGTKINDMENKMVIFTYANYNHVDKCMRYNGPINKNDKISWYSRNLPFKEYYKYDTSGFRSYTDRYSQETG